MQTISLGKSSLKASRLAYGCWRLSGTLNPADVTAELRAAARRALVAAWESGYTLFDTADIYGRGEADRLLGAALKEVAGMRDGIIIATKCGVCPSDIPPGAPHRWNLSAGHILESCEGSLQRLGIGTVDVMMLHRPDYLVNPDEVADAFEKLARTGKVRFFGISNFRPSLAAAVQAACPMPLIVHQVEVSLAKLDVFSDGTLDQCLEQKMTPMAWSPLAGGLIGGGAKRLLALQQTYRPELFLPTLEQVARAHGVERTVVALAWLLKHPSNIIPIIGSNNPERIREAVKATEVELTREEWYELLKAARGGPLP